LLILIEKINSCKMESKRFLIIGDMNGDLQRNRYYTDQKLNAFIQEMNCVSIDNWNRNIDYSFYKMNHNSLIDHVIADRNERSTKMKIENAVENTSDHLALIIEIKTG
jgi:endonuclease/exonuclease/phosphatase family metal-dependent hydrolase